jgi:2-hydroxychromene-2-carboxylate isomerase
MAGIDYFFSLASPWAYLAGDRLERIAAARGAAVTYRPFAIGKVFEATGGVPLPKRHPARQAYRLQELARWRDGLGMPLTLHPAHWPPKNDDAAVALCAAAAAGRDPGPLAQALLRAVWAEERDIADAATIDAILAAGGVDPAALDRAAGAAAYAAHTEKAIRRGVFGSPFYVVGDEMFWGQDRLDLLDRHLARLAA